MPDKVFSMDIKSELVSRIEAMARRIKIKPEHFCFFAVVDTLRVLEGLENVSNDCDLRDQLRDLVDLRSLGVLSDADFTREIEALAEVSDVDDDDAWDA